MRKDVKVLVFIIVLVVLIFGIIMIRQVAGNTVYGISIAISAVIVYILYERLFSKGKKRRK